VLLCDISEPALTTALAKVRELIPTAGKIETKVTDVSKEADIEAAVAHLDSWGGVDVMFNNAGIMHADDADAIDTPERIWDLTQAINVKGVWFGSKHAVLSLRKHGKKKGSIINTGSVVALVGSATCQLAYTASKGAVLALTRELAMCHAREGFRFNALCPAPLKYELFVSFSRNSQLTASALLSFKTGSATTPPNGTGEKSTSQQAVLVRQLNKLRRCCS
jgi:NAD(P)-dependent dehydrogenase (short-subunit alcohol dehydrogenase family)